MYDDSEVSRSGCCEVAPSRRSKADDKVLMTSDVADLGVGLASNKDVKADSEDGGGIALVIENGL